jgi:hypothetical protein
MFSGNTVSKLQRFEAEKPAEAYTLMEMMTDLRRGVFSELAAKKPIDIYRRSLQKDVTERLINVVKPSDASSNISFGGIILSTGSSGSANSDLVSVAKYQLRTLQSEIRTALPTITDQSSKIHLQDLQDRIEKALKND